MPSLKGQLDVATPEEYIAALAEPRRSEVAELDRIIRETVPELEPHIRSGMIGYGPFHYRYASGRDGDWFRIGLASNKSYISLYACAADNRGYVAERYKGRLPKANIGRSCVRFRRIADLDVGVLRDLLRETAAGTFGM
jgi:hypothetical protein